MSSEFVAIDAICELVRGSSPRPQGDPRFFGGSVPRLMVADMTRDGMYVTPSIDSLTEEGAKQSRPMKAGELVMVVSGLVGLPSILKIDACIHDGLVGFRNLDKKVLPEYLYYWLLSSQEKSRAQTSGAIWQNLTTDQIKEWKVPLPTFTEQKRIVSLLERVDHLRQRRRTAHDLGDALLQSVFLEMFGDPQFNEKKWDLVTLGEKITFMTSGSRGWAEHYSAKGDLFLRIQNVGANQLLLDDVAYVQAPDTVESKRTRVQPGDLLISATADLGRTAVIPENFPTAYINQHLFLLRLKDLSPVFVAGYFSTPSGKAQILRLDREGVKSGLNFDDARSLTVFNPPLSLQEEFAGVVARVESLRGRMFEAERQVEGLFESLLAEAFS